MIGLNDLRLQLGVANHFEVLASPIMDGVCAAMRRDGRPFSFGGVARAGDAGMPIPSELVYAQYPRLGATGGLLTRAFVKDLPLADLPAAVATMRSASRPGRPRTPPRWKPPAPSSNAAPSPGASENTVAR